MLLVEWEYIRLYINSLALQAVAERQSTHAVGFDGQPVRVSEEDAIYIEHVVDASKSILTYMIYEFAPKGYLRCSPVKVFLRIISAAVFLVKVILWYGKCLIIRHSLLVVVQLILPRHFHCLILQLKFLEQLLLTICILLIDFRYSLNLF